MSKQLNILEKNGWFAQPGKENDVVLSSRIRFSRNLNGHLYPGQMKQEEEDEVAGKICSALASSDISIGCSRIGEMVPVDRRLLLERNHFSQETVMHTERYAALSEDNLGSCVINEIDHLRFSVFRGGLDISAALSAADKFDTLLEKKLDYAVSFELGYLNSEVSNLGTGMRASVMLHLPALVATNLIDKALKAVVQIGFTVKGFMGEDEHSLGCMYQISNQSTIGSSEEEIAEKLEHLALQITMYERKAREEMLEKKRLEMEDSIFRAYGLLTNCRLLGANEAMDCLSKLRMGAAAGLVDVPLELCNSLVFLSQKAHIQKMLEGQEDQSDDVLIDHTRASFIKNAITQKTL